MQVIVSKERKELMDLIDQFICIVADEQKISYVEAMKDQTNQLRLKVFLFMKQPYHNQPTSFKKK